MLLHPPSFSLTLSPVGVFIFSLTWWTLRKTDPTVLPEALATRLAASLDALRSRSSERRAARAEASVVGCAPPSAQTGRATLQLFPADVRVAAAVTLAGGNPHVELSFSARKTAPSLAHHLAQKWATALRVASAAACAVTGNACSAPWCLVLLPSTLCGSPPPGGEIPLPATHGLAVDLWGGGERGTLRYSFVCENPLQNGVGRCPTGCDGAAAAASPTVDVFFRSPPQLAGVAQPQTLPSPRVAPQEPLSTAPRDGRCEENEFFDGSRQRETFFDGCGEATRDVFAQLGSILADGDGLLPHLSTGRNFAFANNDHLS